MVRHPACVYKSECPPPPWFKFDCLAFVNQTSTPLKATHAPFHHASSCTVRNRSHHTHSRYPRPRPGRGQKSTSNSHQSRSRRRHIHILDLLRLQLTTTQHRRRPKRLQLRHLHQQRRHRLRDRICRRAKVVRNLRFQQRTLLHNGRIRHDRHSVHRVRSGHQHRHDFIARNLVLRGADDGDE